MVTDPTMTAILSAIAAGAHAAGLKRERGGLQRGTAWAERSGRVGLDWGELRLHHRPSENQVSAGLLLYQPLSRGGRTLVAGECTLTYRYSADEVVADVVAAIVDWLAMLAVPEPV